MRIIFAVAMCIAGHTQAGTDTTRWIHGSWVNVRAAQAADSAVIDHLSTNTQVVLRAENGKACEISWGRDGHGFVPCKFLGDRRLMLTEVTTENGPQYSPARAFWIAPSMDALFWAGAHFTKALLSEAQYKLESGTGEGDHFSDAAPRLLRYPVPEFEAMKTVLANGIVASADRDPPLLTCQQMQAAKKAQVTATTPNTTGYLYWSYPDSAQFPHLFPMVSDCRVGELPALRLPNVRPSLFKSSKELLPGSADSERISAHFGIVERGRTVGAPKWERDYDVMRYTGAWDIGNYELKLDKPIVEHAIGRTGLVGAYQWTPQQRQTPFGTSNCAEGLHNRRMGKQVLPGYPSIKDALLWFQAPAALPFKTATIKSRVERVPQTGDEQIRIQRVTIYEIDLNGDGIADFVQWDIWGTGDISEISPLLKRREVFVNINGVWYPFDADYDGECT